MITCNPWNPVDTKKVVPYTLSDREKGATEYSNPWRKVKYNPRMIVNTINTTESDEVRIRWCATVAVTPEDRRTIVLRRGTSRGLINETPIGDHTLPSATSGDKEASKKDQKNPEKNITSEKINRAIPYLRPSWTTWLWCPQSLSETTSDHQVYIRYNNVKIEITRGRMIEDLNQNTRDEHRVKDNRHVSVG